MNAARDQSAKRKGGKATDPTRRRDGRASMHALLAAAIEVFAERGGRAATVEAICRRAGLSKRMLYHHFGSKERLYERALRHVYDEFLAVEISLASMLRPVDELIGTLVRQYYTFLHKHTSFVRLISYENLDYGRTARRLRLGGQKAQIITALRLALEKGQAERRFRRSVDVEELLVSIFALCFFYFSNAHTMSQFVREVGMGRAALDRRIAHVTDLVLHGIVDQEATG